MNTKFLALILFSFSGISFAQEEVKIKSGSFDYNFNGHLYLYVGEYVITKDDGNKEKLPNGKGKLTQPQMETLDLVKKGYSVVPYLYEGDWKLGQKDGEGEERVFSSEGKNELIAYYYGEYQNGLYNGKGRLITDEYEYVGGFKEGKKFGSGDMTFSNKSIYRGNWENDCFHGEGVFIYENSREYFDGIFEKNHFKKGIYFYENGNTYDGDWANDLPEGNGTYRWAQNSDTYIGQFLAGIPYGKGKLTQKDGSFYLGEVRDGNFTGTALIKNYETAFYLENQLTMQRGTYSGEISNNNPNGYGVFRSEKLTKQNQWDSNGETYEISDTAFSYLGNWKSGEKSGMGRVKIILAWGEEYGYEGEVIETVFEGKLKANLYDGDSCFFERIWSAAGQETYNGSFQSGLYHGFGTLDSYGESIHAQYTGSFLNGLFEGEGVYVEEDGIGLTQQKGVFHEGNIIKGTEEFFEFTEEENKITYTYTGSFSSPNGYAVKSGNGKIEYLNTLSELTVDWSENKVKSYEGEWENGVPTGTGKIEYKNGTTVVGEFINGKLIKK